jgi:hypothetical protein
MTTRAIQTLKEKAVDRTKIGERLQIDLAEFFLVSVKVC